MTCKILEISEYIFLGALCVYLKYSTVNLSNKIFYFVGQLDKWIPGADSFLNGYLNCNFFDLGLFAITLHRQNGGHLKMAKARTLAIEPK